MSQLAIAYIENEMTEKKSAKKGLFRSKEDKILDAVLAGDLDQAFRKMYDYYPKIKSMLLSYGASEDDAQDIFQEALLVMTDRLQKPDFVLNAKLSTYLYSVCRFMCKDVIAKNGKTVDIDSFHSIAEEMVVEYEETEQQYAVVDSVLKQLGEKCMNILIGYYYKKKSMQELADEYGYATVNSVKNQKYKCLERAKKMAAEQNDLNL